MRDWMNRVSDRLNRFRRFVTQDVWRIGRPGEEIPSGFITKQIRVGILLLRNLGEDALLVRASALAFWTILSIVPFFALMFLVIQSFNLGGGLYDRLNKELDSWILNAVTMVFGADPETVSRTSEAKARVVPPADAAAAAEDLAKSAENAADAAAAQEDVAHDADAAAAAAEAAAKANEDLKNKIIEWVFQGVAQNTSIEDGKELNNPVKMLVGLAEQGLTNSGAFSFMGGLFVVTTVFGLLQNVEKSFNHIWGVTRSRRWFRTISDYLLVTLLLPILAAIVLGITAALQSEVIAQRLGVFALSLQGVQFLVIWLFITGLYVLVPNARVHKASALLGGIVAAALWTLMSWGYVRFQFSLGNYGIVYSSFAQFPMLLIWTYLSWLILLFGAEVTFAYQHEKTFAMERLAETASHAYKEAVGIRAMIELAARFDEGKPGLSPVEAAEAWNVPSRLVTQSLAALQRAGLVSQCSGESVRYQPARSIDRIALMDVAQALREDGDVPSAFREDDKYHDLFVRASAKEWDAMQISIDEIVHKMRVPEKPPANVEQFPGEARDAQVE
jgi:YihY family inner membrane protein